MSNLRTYADGEPFVGVIDGASDESIPAWPTPPRAPDGVPNVVMFVYIDGKRVGAVDLARRVRLTCGHDGGSRVAPGHDRDSFALTGTLKRVTIDLSGDPIIDSDTDLKVAIGAPVRSRTGVDLPRR